MSKGFDMLRDYIEHDSLCMRRRKCCDFEYELQQEFAALEAENSRLRKFVQSYVDDYIHDNCGSCWGDLCDICDCWLSDCADELRELGIKVEP